MRVSNLLDMRLMLFSGLIALPIFSSVVKRLLFV